MADPWEYSEDATAAAKAAGTSAGSQHGAEQDDTE